jgi:hypothetical protein
MTKSACLVQRQGPAPTAVMLSQSSLALELGELLELQLPFVGTSHEPNVLVHHSPVLLSSSLS